jgi:hypothetical protein
MDFQQRLQRAVERGRRSGDEKARAQAERAFSDEELTRLHTQYRLQLSEHIESCVSKLPDHFPGFQFETILNERGWGGAVRRDDVALGGGGRDTLYSRLEMVIRPPGKYHVLELTAKGTVRNKERFNRSHYQRLDEVDVDSFTELIDLWVLEYAELYAAKG